MDKSNKPTGTDAAAADSLSYVTASLESLYGSAGEYTRPFNTEAPNMPSEWLGAWVPEPIKCECGTDAVGAGKHSSWCPKHAGDL